MTDSATSLPINERSHCILTMNRQWHRIEYDTMAMDIWQHCIASMARYCNGHSQPIRIECNECNALKCACDGYALNKQHLLHKYHYCHDSLRLASPYLNIDYAKTTHFDAAVRWDMINLCNDTECLYILFYSSMRFVNQSNIRCKRYNSNANECDYSCHALTIIKRALEHSEWVTDGKTSGRESGLVCHSGYDYTRIVPIYDGSALNECIARLLCNLTLNREISMRWMPV